MPKINGQFANGDQLPDRDYVDGDAGGPGLNQVLAKVNLAPYVFATVAEAKAATYSEPEYVLVDETGFLYRYDASSTATADGEKCLTPTGGGRLVAVSGVKYDAVTTRIFFGSNHCFDEVNEKFVSTNNGFMFEEENGDTFNLTRYGIEYVAATLDVFQFRTITPNSIDATFRLEARAGSTLSANNVEWTFGNFPLSVAANRFATFGDGASYIQYPTGFNQPNPTAQTHTKGLTSDSSAYGLKVDDSSGTKNFYVRNDGRVEFKNYTLPVADGAAGSFLETDGAGNLSFVLPAYGEAYQTDNSTATTINTVDVWEEIGNFSTGEAQGVTVSSSTMTVNSGQGGMYSVVVSFSGVPSLVNKDYEFAISVNDTIQTKTKQSRYFTNTTITGSVSIHGLLNLSDSDVVKLEIRNTTDDTDFTVINSNMVIHRID